MSDRLIELEQIHSIVVQNPEDVSKGTRKQFWKLVRQIKRNPRPNEQEIMKAAEVRDILFEVDRGKTYPLGPALFLEIILGLLAIWGYIWLLGTPLEWSGILTWTLSDWFTFILRFLCMFFAIAFFFPL
ncbi:MAG: hypothetical protein ACFFBL_09910, partial [Promethearchaeota archaeon]